MNLKLLIILGWILSGGFFFLAHESLYQIEAASTGFNSNSRGLFSWDYEFAEHGYVNKGGSREWALIDSGRVIRYSWLIAEVLFYLILGMAIAFYLVPLILAGTTPSSGDHGNDERDDGPDAKGK